MFFFFFPSSFYTHTVNSTENSQCGRPDLRFTYSYEKLPLDSCINPCVRFPLDQVSSFALARPTLQLSSCRFCPVFNVRRWKLKLLVEFIAHRKCYSEDKVVGKFSVYKRVRITERNTKKIFWFKLAICMCGTGAVCLQFCAD